MFETDLARFETWDITLTTEECPYGFQLNFLENTYNR